MRRHLILVGLPGAGKSTVGRLAAAELNVPLIDIDATIQSQLGVSVAEIFAERGETEFRRMERTETIRATEAEPAVIVPGGGWAAQAGNLESVSESATTVYLETSVATAADRLRDGETRPLLVSQDPEAKLQQVYAARKASYERCEHRITTDGKTAEQVAREVTELALKGD